MLVSEIQTRYLGKGHERVSKQGSSSIIDDIMSKTNALERISNNVYLTKTVAQHS